MLPYFNFDYTDKTAIVDEVIQPHQKGRVRFQGSVWPAECHRELTLNPGDRVQVLGRNQITLVVDSLPRSELFHKSKVE